MRMLLAMFMAAVAVYVAPDLIAAAWASGSNSSAGGTITGGTTSGGASGFAKVLCNVRNLFVGQTGTAVATLAIIFLGVGAFFGKVSWGVALLVAVGIAAIFGADEIVKTVANEAVVCRP